MCELVPEYTKYHLYMYSFVMPYIYIYIKISINLLSVEHHL
jgi:hypothetical protein